MADHGYELYPQYTIGLHAWFLQQIQAFDPALSAQLHDGETDKAFNLSGLSGQFSTQSRSLQLQAGKTYQWTVNGLTKPVVAGLAQWLKQLPEVVALKNAPLVPTGVGGFARDYTVYFEAGDQVAIDVTSDDFDTLVILMNKDGVIIGENDDGPDGTTNSLLFARIKESGTYTVRVQAYAGQGTGNFFLKVARLREVQ
ncbi:hypothetical protein [Leptolyngbya sp. KIOST-1]|uniref:hypothetical protein n=1 Tax=Leptolyngbya sp. KIOST-1 TaxID=1229172 RepID=UPI000AD44B0E|nr:hypothetical protein [Leptolyngbya sp. KIOST-1]